MPHRNKETTMRLMNYYPAKPAANMTPAECVAFIYGGK
jgi:hypothetical protein